MSIWVRKGKPGELELVFPYNEEYIAKIKSINGRKWDKENKRWLIPDNEESIKKLLGLFTKGEVVTDKTILVTDESVQADTDRINAKFAGMMKDTLKLKGYSPKTIKSYMSHVRLFLQWCGKSADAIQNEDINKYLLFLLEVRKSSHSYVNQAVNSIYGL
ncbi:MAG: phage integrase N-terminal SAM-like domain-containing protein [Caulobacteraceae bacterium]